MDVVLVGLPGSGKSVIGKRLAASQGAMFVDLDEAIEAAAGVTIQALFETEGEAGFRDRERVAIEALGGADGDHAVRRVIATGGGAVIDPRNRWRLYRDRSPIWLDVRPDVAVQRLRGSRHVRPLVARSADPVEAVRELATARQRFYAAAVRVAGASDVTSVLDGTRRALTAGHPSGTTLLRAETRIGRLVLGDGIAAAGIVDALDRQAAGRAILVSEPNAWAVAGERIGEALRATGRRVDVVMLPSGEAAKRLGVIETAARELARLRAERSEPLVAIGGGALGDAAGFLAATWLRGVPIVHVPTTLVGQIDSAIGGKTAVDLPEGKNLVGAFHQPAAIVIDVSFLRTLPERDRRAALGEAVKMAALGDDRLFDLLEADGPAIARGDAAAFASGAVAELVERCAWAKVEVVLADERETGATGGRIALNLGHSAGHAFEAVGGYRDLLHGEAVAYGLRVACRIGRAIGVTPAERAARIESLLDRLELGRGSLPYSGASVRGALETDKKRTGGRLRWVLPTATGVTIRSDVPDGDVDAALAGLLAGNEAQTAAETAEATR